jgi:hypothetical protein
MIFLLFLPFFLYAYSLTFSSKININSDFIPAYELLNKWKTFYKKKGKNLAFIYNNENLIYNYNNYKIGILREDFYYIKASEDTPEFIYLLLNKEKIKKNRIFNLKLKLYGYSVNGIKIGKIFNCKNFNILLDVDVLKGAFMQDGNLEGKAVTFLNGNYHYEGEVDYYYTHNYLYHLKVKKPTFIGYRMNLKIKYFNNYFSYYLKVKNLFGFIKWKNLPYSRVYIQTNNKDKSKGYLIYKPSISGVEKYLNYKQKLFPYISSYINFKKLF